MAKPKRNKIQRLEDLKYIKKLYLKGVISPNQITTEINKRYKKSKVDIELTVGQIQYDVRQMITELKSEVIEDTKDIVAIQEQRILAVIREAYQAWTRSIGEDIETTQTEGTKPPKNEEEEEKQIFKTTTTRKRKLPGDPRFLSIIDSSIEKISRLHKLYDKEKEKETDDGMLSQLVEMLKPEK